MDPNKKQYVLCFAHGMPGAQTQSIVLIERAKADWQHGRLNLPGGSIHVGYETVEEAAVRELKEETGIEAMRNATRVLGVMDCGNCQVHVCWVPYLSDRNEPRTLSDEGTIIEMYWTQALNDPRLIPNLQVIIPLCQARLEGWKFVQAENDENMFVVQVQECKVVA